MVIGLDNATLDPCSISNAANITPTLRQLCISTGMSAAQVGTVEDIVAGQINVFDGTDLSEPADDRAGGHDDGRLRLDAGPRRAA